MSRNVELKARYPDLASGHRTARSIGAVLHAVERQRDTYFHARGGRLKLRERWRLASPPSADCTAQDPRAHAEPAQLIWYCRADEAGPRASDYTLVGIPAGEQLLHLLAGALGVVTQVTKHRTVYLLDDVRIHLDDVSGLGTFIEFEAIVDERCDNAAAQAKLARLRADFAIETQQLIGQSYGDMVPPAQ